jgi:hypothetical protein
MSPELCAVSIKDETTKECPVSPPSHGEETGFVLLPIPGLDQASAMGVLYDGGTIPKLARAFCEEQAFGRLPTWLMKGTSRKTAPCP